MNTENFIKSSLRNFHINERNIRLYLRKSKRLINGEYIETFDIGSVTVVEKYQKTGVFTRYLKKLISKHPEFNIYVESILNPILVPFLLRNGFQLIEDHNPENVNMILYSKI